MEFDSGIAECAGRRRRQRIGIAGDDFFKGSNLLLFAVFEDLELILRQLADVMPGFVGDYVELRKTTFDSS
jgi:hypothetical protein